MVANNRHSKKLGKT